MRTTWFWFFRRPHFLCSQFRSACSQHRTRLEKALARCCNRQQMQQMLVTLQEEEQAADSLHSQKARAPTAKQRSGIGGAGDAR